MNDSVATPVLFSNFKPETFSLNNEVSNINEVFNLIPHVRELDFSLRSK